LMSLELPWSSPGSQMAWLQSGHWRGALCELEAHLEFSRYPNGRASKWPMEGALLALGAHLEFTK